MPLGASDREKGTAAVFGSRSGQRSEGVDTAHTARSLHRSFLRCPLSSMARLSFNRHALSTSCMSSIPEHPRCRLCGQPPMGSQRGCWQGGRQDRVQALVERRVRGGRPDGKRVTLRPPLALGPLPTCPLAAPHGACPNPAGMCKAEPSNLLQTRFFWVPSQQRPVHLFSSQERS